MKSINPPPNNGAGPVVVRAPNNGAPPGPGSDGPNSGAPPIFRGEAPKILNFALLLLLKNHFSNAFSQHLTIFVGPKKCKILCTPIFGFKNGSIRGENTTGAEGAGDFLPCPNSGAGPK